MRTMANLPLTGSQYWGAALNNYLRQINSDVAALKLRLDNFTVSAQYSGSGWAENTYTIAVNAEHEAYAEPCDDNMAVFKFKSSSSGNFNPTFKISGTLIFNNPATGRSQSINIPDSQNMKITFGQGQTDADDLKVVHYLEFDKNGDYQFKSRGSAGLGSIMPSDGYYPVYAVYDKDAGFKVVLNKEQEFIFTENYVLLGIALRATVSGSTTYFFGRKTDTAFKTAYETRKGNLESFATVVNAANSAARGIFQPTFDENNNSTGLKVLLGTSIIDYQSNGISMTGNAASENDWDYKYPFDYKRFNASGRGCYIVGTDKSGSDTLTSFETSDVSLIDSQAFSSGGLSLALDQIYGIYLSCLGDILIDSTGAIDTLTDLSGYTSDYIWDLNSDSNFRTGGLVFLGAFYHGSTGWTYMPAAANSISPSFISSKTVENANIVKLTDVNYLAYKQADGTVGDPVAYRYEVKVPKDDTSYSKNYYYLTMDTTFITSVQDDAYKHYHIPVMPHTFYKPLIENKSYTGMRIGELEIVQPSSIETAVKWKLDANGVLHGNHQFVSSKTSTTHASASLGDGYDNILENVELAGKVRLSTATADNAEFSVNNRTITNITGLDTLDGFVWNAAGDMTIKPTATKLTIKTDTSKNLELQAYDLTLNALNILTLQSAKPIQVSNTLQFTSDIRCKTNIQDLSTDICVDLVKKLKSKSFTYTTNGVNSIGIIAQELEELCPEYKDYLISTIEADGLSDKRTVAETKLLFILWQAVQYLLNRGE